MRTGRLMRRGPGIYIARAKIDLTPPPGGLQPDEWGYQPPIPAGYTLIENQTLSIAPQTTNRYYRNCNISEFTRVGSGVASLNDSHHLIFADCDFGATLWIRDVHDIQVYGGECGPRVDNDGMNIARSDNPVGPRCYEPYNLLFQGLRCHAITRTGSGHVDALQIQGGHDITFRYFRADQGGTQGMFAKGGAFGRPRNMLFDKCNVASLLPGFTGYFNLSENGSTVVSDIEIRDPYTGNAPSGVNIDASCAASGCSKTGTHRNSSAWPYPEVY